MWGIYIMEKKSENLINIVNKWQYYGVIYYVIGERFVIYIGLGKRF